MSHQIFTLPLSAMEDFNDRSEGTNEFKEDSGAEDAAVGKDGSSTSLVLKQFCSTRCEIRLTYCPWYPQGISHSGAAQEGNLWGADWLIVSWYHKPGEKGVRLSVINLLTQKYRHLLVLDPTSSGPKKLGVHAGGIAWTHDSSGADRIFLVDTSRGLIELDLDSIYAADPNQDASRLGGSPFSALGYKYVVPVAKRYTPSTSGYTSFSWISYDRQANQLLTGPYRTSSATEARTMWKWPTQSGAFVPGPRDGYRSSGLNPYLMQGGQVVGGNVCFSTSGTAHLQCSDWAGASLPASHAWVYGTEDLTYSSYQDQIWTVSEHPNRRFLVAAKLTPLLPTAATSKILAQEDLLSPSSAFESPALGIVAVLAILACLGFFFVCFFKRRKQNTRQMDRSLVLDSANEENSDMVS